MRPLARACSLGASFATLVASLAAASAGAVLLSSCASCDSIVRLTALPAIAANNFDGVEADQAGHRVFLADQTNRGIDVVDTSGATPRFMGTVDMPAPPNGLAFAPGSKRLYAGLIGGTVAVVDADALSATYMQVVDKVTVDTNTADLLDFSPRTNNLYVGTGSSDTVVVVDAASDKVTQTLNVKSPVEQPRFDPADGRIYVTTPHTDSILQLDPSTGAVTRTFSQSGCRPSGLAINPGRQLAVVACRSSVAVFNLRTGLDEISRTVPGGDIVTYDSRVDRFSIGSSHGPRDSSVGVFTGDGHFMAQVQSSPNAHGAVFDDSRDLLYAQSSVGLLSFSPAACAPPPDWLTFTGGLSVFVAPVVLFAVFLVVYSRRRERPRGPTWDELQHADLEAERERIRALEDAIYGPQNG